MLDVGVADGAIDGLLTKQQHAKRLKLERCAALVIH